MARTSPRTEPGARSAPRAAGARVDESVRAAPDAPLRRHVAWYSGYRQTGLGPARHRGLPSPFLTLIFTLDEPLDIAEHADPAQPPESYLALLGGLHTTPALITHPGRQSGIQVALGPLAARRLLGVPAGELARIDLHAADVLGPVSERVREWMQAAPDWAGRFAAVDAGLRERLAAADGRARIAAEVPPEVALAWRRLLASGGTVPVASLADEVGWSSRHLAARFRTEIGLTPKAAARVIRFDRVRRAVVANGFAPPAAATTLAELAMRYGYFDQAHLDREFRDFTGCSPSRWLFEERANFAAAHGRGADAARVG